MKLADWRKAKGWTLQRLADELGCAVGTIARYEAGARHPEREVRKEISILTREQVSPNDFDDLPAWRAERIEREARAELDRRAAE